MPCLIGRPVSSVYVSVASSYLFDSSLTQQGDGEVVDRLPKRARSAVSVQHPSLGVCTTHREIPRIFGDHLPERFLGARPVTRRGGQQCGVHDDDVGPVGAVSCGRCGDAKVLLCFLEVSRKEVDPCEGRVDCRRRCRQKGGCNAVRAERGEQADRRLIVLRVPNTNNA